MKRAMAAAALAAVTLAATAAVAGDPAKPVPLADFIKVFTDYRATSAQKELGLPPGTWYEGVITVSDVEYYKAQGKDPAWVEIKDWNYVGGCHLLLFRTTDVEGGLTLHVNDRVLVRAKLGDIGIHLGKYVSNCETQFAVFTETAILGRQVPSN